LKSVKKCVTTYRPNGLDSKMEVTSEIIDSYSLFVFLVLMVSSKVKMVDNRHCIDKFVE